MNIYLQVKDFILTVISNKWHSYFHARICSGFILKLHLLEIVLPIKKINKPLHMYDTTREINQKLQNLQPHFPTTRCLEQWDTMDSSCISDRPRISTMDSGETAGWCIDSLEPSCYIHVRSWTYCRLVKLFVTVLLWPKSLQTDKVTLTLALTHCKYQVILQPAPTECCRSLPVI